MLAAESSQAELVAALLLDARAELNAQSCGGMTALMWSARHNRGEMVGKLLAAGAAEDVKTDSGWRARELAKMLGHKDVVKLFRAPPWVRWLPTPQLQQLGEKVGEQTPKLILLSVLGV